jgi:hypothetical protein
MFTGGTPVPHFNPLPANRPLPNGDRFGGHEIFEQPNLRAACTPERQGELRAVFRPFGWFQVICIAPELTYPAFALRTLTAPRSWTPPPSHEVPGENSEACQLRRGRNPRA